MQSLRRGLGIATGHLIYQNSRRTFSNQQKNAIFLLGKLNHVAIVVPSLETATKFYQSVLNARCSAPQKLPEHGVTTVFVELKDFDDKKKSSDEHGGPYTKLELLEPLDDKSPIHNFLQKSGGGIHHICLEVDDIQGAVRQMREKKVRILGDQDVTKPYQPKLGAHGKPVVFLHPKDCGGVLVELEQK